MKSTNYIKCQGIPLKKSPPLESPDHVFQGEGYFFKGGYFFKNFAPSARKDPALVYLLIVRVPLTICHSISDLDFPILAKIPLLKISDPFFKEGYFFWCYLS